MSDLLIDEGNFVDEDAVGLVIVNVLVVAVVMVAALGKFASPSQLRAALEELLGVERGGVPIGAVHAIGFVELGAAAALLVGDSRLVGASAIGVLGLGFAAVGVAGHLRNSTIACGCLGRRDRGQPLGLTSLLAGVGLLGVLPLNVALTGGASGHDYAAAVPAGAAGAALVMAVLLQRRLIAGLLRRVPAERIEPA